MKLAFETVNFTAKTLALIELMDQILTEYGAMGYRLTIRQLYYQLVARDVIPNSQRSYKRVVDIAGKARNAGKLDWYAIEDRARSEIYPAHWADPAKGVRRLAEQFRVDRWINQPNHVEVMLEKDALAGVLEPVCEELDVRLFPNKGYASLSMMFRHGIRLHNKQVEGGKELHIIYVGDHDPSGMDMDRDIQDRLDTYSFGKAIHFKRVALTMAQIHEYDPPPQWAKAQDSRTPEYVAQYGNDVWELDALEPDKLAEVVKDAVLELRDEDLYAEVMEIDQAMNADLETFADEWQEKVDAGDLEYMEDWYKELAY